MKRNTQREREEKKNGISGSAERDAKINPREKEQRRGTGAKEKEEYYTHAMEAEIVETHRKGMTHAGKRPLDVRRF